MITYTLPQMKEIEHKLLRLISGSDRILTEWKTWPSGELTLHVSGMEPKVCVIGRSVPPAENLVRTILLMDTLQRSGSKSITLLVPYLAYSRQDRPRELGDPNSAACMTRLFAGMGVDRLVTLDLHSDRVVESSHVLIQNVSVLPDMAAVLSKDLGKEEDFVVVSPDRGGRHRAELFAAGMGRQMKAVWIEKERGPSGVRGKRVMGRVEAKSAVIIDDILDSGSTIKESVRLLQEKGVEDFYLCIVHPVCSGRAPHLLREIKFKKILISDSLDAPVEVHRMKEVQVVSAARILAEAVLGGPPVE
jgi:ribose-phosphate pyrophosphokinase